MTQASSHGYVSRGGDKLAAALDHFGLDVTGRVCADLGSHVGGFVDCLLGRGAARVYSVDTAYGVLAWKLRKDARVVVMERTNAMHVTLPEPVDIATIDVGWTPQSKVLPNVARLISPTARVVTLIKPHYEAGRGGTAYPTKSVDTEAPHQSEPGAQATGPQTLRWRLGLGSGSHSHADSSTPLLVNGVLQDSAVDDVIHQVLRRIAAAGWRTINTMPSPIRGHAGNREVFALLTGSQA